MLVIHNRIATTASFAAAADSVTDSCAPLLEGVGNLLLQNVRGRGRTVPRAYTRRLRTSPSRQSVARRKGRHTKFLTKTRQAR